MWSNHSEAKRQKQEHPIEIQRTTFKRTHVNNINCKSKKNSKENQQTRQERKFQKQKTQTKNMEKQKEKHIN